MAREKPRPPAKKYSLGLTDIPGGSFEHDLSISDRYQSFSAEILRLSLLGIAGIGFLLANLFVKDSNNPSYKAFVSSIDIKWYLSASLICLGGAVGFALLHRYFSTDSIACHLRYIRFEKNGLRDHELAVKEEKSRNWGFSLSYWFLWCAALFLGAGAIFLAVAFIIWLGAIKP